MVYHSEVSPPPRFLQRALPFAFAVLLVAQTTDFDGRPAVILRNDKIELTILTRGATLASYEILISDDEGRRVCTARLTCVIRDAQ